MHGAMRCPTPLWPHPSPLFRPCEGRGPEAVLPVVSLQHLVRRGPSRFGQLGGELLEVQPVAREDEADEVVAGRRLDRAKSTDRKTTISPRTASGAALSRASNASASPRQGAVDRAGSSGPGDYVSEGGYSVMKPGNYWVRYFVVSMSRVAKRLASLRLPSAHR